MTAPVTRPSSTAAGRLAIVVMEGPRRLCPLVDRRSRAHVDRRILRRAHDEAYVFLGDVAMERQRQRAVGDLFRDEEVALRVTQLRIVILQMQRIAERRGFDVLGSEVVENLVARAPGETRAQMHE